MHTTHLLIRIKVPKPFAAVLIFLPAALVAGVSFAKNVGNNNSWSADTATASSQQSSIAVRLLIPPGGPRQVMRFKAGEWRCQLEFIDCSPSTYIDDMHFYWAARLLGRM